MLIFSDGKPLSQDPPSLGRGGANETLFLAASKRERCGQRTDWLSRSIGFSIPDKSFSSSHPASSSRFPARRRVVAPGCSRISIWSAQRELRMFRGSQAWTFLSCPRRAAAQPLHSKRSNRRRLALSCNRFARCQHRQTSKARPPILLSAFSFHTTELRCNVIRDAERPVGYRQGSTASTVHRSDSVHKPT